MQSRKLAARIVDRVLKDGQSLTAALEQSLPKLESANDRAFVQALSYGTIREFYRLQFFLDQLLEKPIKDGEIKALALIGLYQLEYMRVKAHAAVSETVAAVSRKKAWAKPLLNAVLRHYQRRRETLQALAENDPVAAANHPRWLLDLIESNWPDQAQKLLTANNQQAPMALRVNLARIDRAAYLQLLHIKGIAAQPSNICASAIVLERAIPVEQLPGFQEGRVSVQDVAAQLAAGLLDLHAGQQVIDVCAAPGGKLAHILETRNDIHLKALEIDAERMEKARETLQRLNLQAKLIVADAADPVNWPDDSAYDRILLDAPCSALGVIRRHPDIKLLRKADDIASLIRVQKTLLETAWRHLKPDGILLYATCSIARQENEAQIEGFIQHHDDAEEWPIDAAWGQPRPHGRQILSGEQGMDGFYYARLRKK